VDGMDINLNRMGFNSNAANVGTNQNSNMDKSQCQDNTTKSVILENKEERISEKDLKSAVDTANKVLFKNDSHLKFEIHEKTKEVMVRIVDNQTGETLKEIPPKKIIDMINKLCEIAGVLVDERR
jgi:flagellar protein FlaG